MKAGQIVAVYQEPLTEKRFEGDAVLVERYDGDVSFVHDGQEFQAWWVRFYDDMKEDGVGCTTYRRIIKVQ